VRRAIASMVGLEEAPFERECSKAICERMKIKSKGLVIPYDIQMNGQIDRDYTKHPDYRQFLGGRRDLTVGSATAGGNLVGTVVDGASFIDILRAKLVTRALGVRYLTGLVGNFTMPRQTAATAAEWVAESSAATEGAPTYGQVAMTPNDVSAWVEVSIRLLSQSTPGIEGILQSDLAQAIAIAIDTAFYHGSGGNQPTGLESTTGVGTTNGANLTWQDVIDFETDVATANADVAGMAYVTNAAGVGILKGRERAQNTAQFMMRDDGTMNGYPVARTNIISAGYMFFGDHQQGVIGEWGVMELIVNPYSRDTEGLVRITTRHLADVGIRQPGAFTYADDLS
jgi:HK97 family phage major capsid protein